MEKKAELTTQQIVGLIILIVSFTIILFFLFRLNLDETSDKEICHNSVVMKGQSVLGGGNLDCKIAYVCISGGEDCEDFNPSKTIDINPNEKNAKDEIVKAINTEMSDCWWMFGEGKIDYIGDWLNKPGFLETHRCAICSIIKFDKTIQENFVNLQIGEKEILTENKYFIITGMEDKEEYIEPIIVQSTSETTFEEFLTKA